MIKKDELIDPTSCLNKALADEPVFVFRAKDKLAPILVSMWAALAALHGCPIEKVLQATNLAQAMEDYAGAMDAGRASAGQPKPWSKWPD